jgi:hypothetical protein
LLIFFGLIELAISAWLTARYGKKHDAPNSGINTRTQFILFSSIWTVFFSFLFGILFFHSNSGSILTSVMSHGILYVFLRPLNLVVVDPHYRSLLLTWVFWTAAAASITAALGGGLNCR